MSPASSARARPILATSPAWRRERTSLRSGSTLARSTAEEAGATSNGDIAEAVDRLSDGERCDIINISSGGLTRSELEANRIAGAFERGTLIACSAGNRGAPPVLYPAAHRDVVAVSALGTRGSFLPPRSKRSAFPPRQIATPRPAPSSPRSAPSVRRSAVSARASESRNGARRRRLGARLSGGKRHVDGMPVVVGALAALLASDTTYRSLPCGRQRSLWAWNLLARALPPLGLLPAYQGYGSPRLL